MAQPLDLASIDSLFTAGEGAPGLDEKVDLAQGLRRHSPEISRALDQAMLQRLDDLHRGLQEAQVNLKGLEGVLEQICAPPWYVADFIGLVDTPQGPRALVACNGRRSLVLPHGQFVKPAELVCGDEVLLSNQLNVLMARSPRGPCRFGETATFARRTADGRLVLRSGEAEMIVEPAGNLSSEQLKDGDLVRWDRQTWLAHERIESPCEGRRYLLDKVQPVATDQVGGQEGALRTLISALATTLIDPPKARAYQQSGRRSILLVGPPGCGKTLMARIAASEVARLSGRRCRFGVVKPAEWEDPYVGVTTQNIRNCFRALKEAAADAMAVLFLDEVESIGRIRGGVSNHHSDKFLAALLVELNGFDDRSNVAIISASNRKDLIDPGLLERIGETEVAVGRPDMRGAKAIFGIHLPDSVPMNPNHSASSDTRRQIIDAAVSLLYAPNAGNEVCVLHFRDGSTRTIHARELVSGRLIAQITNEACQRAFYRDVAGGQPGVTVADMRHAVGAAILKLSTTLSPRNVHTYLTDLSRDMDVVDIRPIRPKVDRPHRFLTTM